MSRSCVPGREDPNFPSQNRILPEDHSFLHRCHHFGQLSHVGDLILCKQATKPVRGSAYQLILNTSEDIRSAVHDMKVRQSETQLTCGEGAQKDVSLFAKALSPPPKHFQLLCFLAPFQILVRS